MSRREGADRDIELSLLLDAIYHQYHYDFRGYARSSLKRRLRAAMTHSQSASLSQLQHYVLHHPESFPELLNFLTVPVSEMFRDPTYFLSIRTFDPVYDAVQFELSFPRASRPYVVALQAGTQPPFDPPLKGLVPDWPQPPKPDANAAEARPASVQRYGPQRIADRWHVYDSACGHSSAVVQPHSAIGTHSP